MGAEKIIAQARAIKKKDAGYQGYANWDTWNVALILQNDERLYNHMLAWKKNFLLKKKRGKFDKQKAIIAVKKYLVQAARKKEAEYAGYKNLREFSRQSELDRINPKKVNAKEILDVVMRD